MKKGFTYLELVIVIVVIGILALVSLDRLKRDGLYEAADQLLTHIRYTQHLAMLDDSFDPNDAGWRAKQYRVQLHNMGDIAKYSVYKLDNNNNIININEPVTNEPICGVCDPDNSYNKADMKKYFGIEDVTVSGGLANNGRIIMFDALGRPLMEEMGTFNIATRAIDIELCTKSCSSAVGNEEMVTIRIHPETGYSHIL